MPKRHVWENWDGKRVETVGRARREEYIATTSNQWDFRLLLWKRYLQDEDAYDTPCPCPMPEGHLMFNGTCSNYRALPEVGKPVQQDLI